MMVSTPTSTTRDAISTIYLHSSRCTCFLLILAIIILGLLNDVEAQNVINSKNLYTFGDFNFNGFGSLVVPTAPTPVSNTILQKLLVNSTESWKLASAVEDRLDVSVSVQQLVNHYHAMFYILEYFNTTSNNSLGQFVFVSGSNENGQAAIRNPPPIMSEPELIYIYTDAGKASNPFSSSRRIVYMSCVRSCVILTSDGKVYYHNALGIWTLLFSITQYTDPDTAATLTNVKFVSAAIGGYFTCETVFAVTNYGHVFSWGCYNFGLRGTPSSYSDSGVYMIPSLRNITTVSSGQRPGNTEAGRTAASAIDVNGVLWTWGSNYNGLLGWNSTVNATSEFPQPVTLLPSKVKSIAFGYGHALAVLDTGDVYGFGENANKQSNPDSAALSAIYVPARMNITENVTECFAAGFSSACLLNSGYIVSWGFVNSLGHSSSPNYNKVTMVNDAQVVMARISNVHGLAITSDGLVNVWGVNTNAVLTLGEERAIRYPRKLSVPSFANGNVTVSKIIGGGSCMFVLSKVYNDTVTNNGLDYWGECKSGLNFGTAALTPKTAPQTLTERDISTIDIRLDSAIAFTNGGEVHAWGNAIAFTGVASTVSNPMLIASDVKKVSIGSDNTYVLFNNDTLWGIGDNSYYQMCLGSSVSTGAFISFTQINTTAFLYPNEQITDIRAGQTNVFLLTNLGNVYGCGRNGASERFISNSGLSSQSTFLRVNGNIKFRKMYIGFYTSLFLISTTGQFYYLYGTLLKSSLPVDDAYVVDICDYSGRYFIISRKGNLYTSGLNTAYETNYQKGYSALITAPALYSREYFDGIPYMVSCSESRTAIVTREEYSCFGVNSTDPSVCSSHGHCQGPNDCLCDEGYSGLMCANYTCNSISPSNSTVCSGRGNCTAPETCSNCINSIGTYCQYLKCFGVYSNNVSVCSGNGTCSGFDKCDCKVGFYGNKCQYRSCFGSAWLSFFKNNHRCFLYKNQQYFKVEED